MGGCFAWLRLPMAVLGLAASAAGLQAYPETQVCRLTDVSVEWVHGTMKRQGVTEYDIWGHSRGHVDVQVPRSVAEVLEGCEVMVEDVDALLQEQAARPGAAGRDGAAQVPLGYAGTVGDVFFDDFQDLETIYMWLDMLEQTYPGLVTVERVGQTYEGREMRAVHISAGNEQRNPDKKTVVITGGVHAREWIGVSTACFVVERLLSRYGRAPKETRYLDALDFLVIPVFNPDGYAYTWTHDRLWRKNRQPTYMPGCDGVDIDHSFDYHWTGQHAYPCSGDYSGQQPFEAVEARSWNDYVNKTKAELDIYAYLDLHSYSEEILYPYAYSCDALPRDLENLLELAHGLARAIRRKSGRNYDVLASCKDRGSDLSPGMGSGSALDYMYHHRARWAFQFKLRDTGSRGFLLPAAHIKPVGRELYAALMYFCDFILNPEL
ncbi:AFR045Wp [Eremothecium gossypii ATCC 10895]|uniref:Inactive metallocarboxypeptidase ECM14 n=1 Tax=Eremothecium gossypii (strain ATCC 10895 / CBS 109.51 / FGSC 9923 / NRRL Y-1056) TaxID=284811 RepID=Q754M7_EREGS|nr:AFR045Wp [Eremothecium gossypii ATCC 10895]AAS53416.1 AFR045Wp [Eremothecium gossypii ATCC 10895]AEY97728.1 FAFR045Wp [Eremothecium gossypii FDAG1]